MTEPINQATPVVMHAMTPLPIDFGDGFIVTIRPLASHEATAVVRQNVQADTDDIETEARLVFQKARMCVIGWTGAARPNMPCNDYDHSVEGPLTKERLNEAFTQRPHLLMLLAKVILSSAYLTRDQLGNSATLLLARLGNGVKLTTAKSAPVIPLTEPPKDATDPQPPLNSASTTGPSSTSAPTDTEGSGTTESAP